ncbi:ESF1 homolog [Sceloporus undulatus]|uniref:ESF1 homolog n=1 Tax=Sceloporus undulatus TaxID=8520 RepID=UPI001C4ADD6D|nr:ESF1 homolog [Sceloporus undulatus]
MEPKKEVFNDQRFSRITKDPRFWEMPEKDRKIKIDKRFRAMFHDKKFKLKYTVDKRGRPVNHSSTEDLKRFYALSDSDSDVSEGDGKRTEKKKTKSKGKRGSEKSVDAKDSNVAGYKSSPVSRSDVFKNESQKGKPLKTMKDNKNTTAVSAVHEKDDSSVSCVNKKDLKNKTCKNEESSDLDEPEDSGETEEEKESDKNGELEEEIDDGEVTEESTSDDGEGETGEGSETDDDESDSGPDLARGKGNVETSSEDEEEDDMTDLFPKDPEIVHRWGELSEDAPREDKITCRLAVCNMDWDRLKAKDLLALFNSFTPKGGVIFSVKIYPSEFGKIRMKEEEISGPTELLSLPENVTEKDRFGDHNYV